MTDVYYDYFDSPVGRLLLVLDGQGLRHVAFENGRHPTPIADDTVVTAVIAPAHIRSIE